VAPAVGWRASTRLPRDHYIRLDSNDYSVHPTMIGRRVEVIADLDRVRVVCEGRPVAEHDRVWARHQTITDPEHRIAAAALRRQRLQLVSPPTGPATEVEVRPLSEYDAALGLDELSLDDGGVA
jgi:hypothetical protein